MKGGDDEQEAGRQIELSESVSGWMDGWLSFTVIRKPWWAWKFRRFLQQRKILPPSPHSEILVVVVHT